MKIGILFALLSALGYSAMPLLASGPYSEGVTPFSLLALRFLIAALVLRLGFSSSKAPRARLSGVFFALLAFCYFAALKFIPSSEVALLLYLYPVWVLVGEVVFFKARVRPLQILGVALSLLGISISIGLSEWTSSSHRIEGVLLATLSSVFYAAYILLQSRIKTEVLSFASSVMQTAGVLFLVLTLGEASLAGHFSLPSSLASWLSIFALAGVSSVMSVSLFSLASRRLGPSLTSLISTSEAVFTILLGALFLGETLRPQILLGGTFVLTGACLFVSARRSSAN